MGLLGGSGAVAVAATVLVLRVFADRCPTGVPFWPALDVKEAVATLVLRAVRTR